MWLLRETVLRRAAADLKDAESDERRHEGPDNGAGNVRTALIKETPNTAEGADRTNEDVESVTVS